MQSRLRVADQAVHPLMLMFPLGLFALAVILDAGTLGGGPPILGGAAHLTILAGLVGGATAVSAAWFDATSALGRAEVRAGFLGILIDLGVLVAFAVIAVIRLRTPGRTADPGLLTIESVALAATGFSAWYAGRLGGRRARGTARAGPAVAHPYAGSRRPGETP